jgi:hypothetical protein
MTPRVAVRLGSLGLPGSSRGPPPLPPGGWGAGTCYLRVLRPFPPRSPPRTMMASTGEQAGRRETTNTFGVSRLPRVTRGLPFSPHPRDPLSDNDAETRLELTKFIASVPG